MYFSDNEKKAVRKIDYEIHCHEVTISQPNLPEGHLLKGHGKIKQLNSGMLILEFICLESRHSLRGVSSVPDDFAIEEQTIYLEAKSIDLKLIKSKKMYFEINLFHAIHQGPNFYRIPLEQIEFEQPPYNDNKDYSCLELEFHGEPDIPPNKINTVERSDGSGSSSWNETVFGLQRVKYSIKSEKGYTKVSVRYPHEADIETIKAALLFYINISTSRLIQPYLVEIDTQDSCKTLIYSFNKKTLHKKMPRAIGAWTSDDSRKRITDEHYEIFKNILLLSLIQPEIAKSINAQWVRIWHGFNSDSSEITMLTLSVSIEGILNDIYIPHIKHSLSSNTLESEKKCLINTLKNTEGINAPHLRSITESILKWGNIYPAKALSYLHEHGVITSIQKKDWNDLRNSSAHPRLSKPSEVRTLKRRRRITSCCGLFYRLMFNILEYQGPQFSFDEKQRSEIYPYTRVLPDWGLSNHDFTVLEE